jgi:hypothetical protein
MKNIEIMSALTPRKMREIDEQLRELKAKRAPKVLLTIFYNIKRLNGTYRIPQMIMDSIRALNGVILISNFILSPTLLAFTACSGSEE